MVKLAFSPVADRLRAGRALRVIFLNDAGFLGGAGIAQRRQALSFLLQGHDVGVVCWDSRAAEHRLEIHGVDYPGRWLGVMELKEVHHSRFLDEDAIAGRVCSSVSALKPDLVIVGNLHWANWPIRIVRLLRERGVATVVYLHDCSWITGRCAYFGTCEKYLSGCDHTCPTATQYPPLAADLIEAAWNEKRELFVGEDAVPLAANSAWTAGIAKAGYHSQCQVNVLYLGIDTNLFAPLPKQFVRRLLGLPQDRYIVLTGAWNLREERKGGQTLLATLERISQLPDVCVVVFGHASEGLHDAITSVGVITDERIMPLVINSADMLINASTEEAFGQTLLEASACGVPIVGVNAGGVSEIARPDENALLVPRADPDELFAATERLLGDAALRERLGAAGRQISEAEFSLDAQYRHWHDYLTGTLAG